MGESWGESKQIQECDRSRCNHIGGDLELDCIRDLPIFFFVLKRNFIGEKFRGFVIKISVQTENTK